MAGSSLAQPSNDNVSSASSLNSSASISTTGTNIGATREAGELLPAGGGGRSVWFTWTALSSGRLTLTTAGSNFDTTLALYRRASGTGASGLSLLASNDDTQVNATSALSANVVQGETYLISVDGYSGVSGTYRLNLSFRNSANTFSAPGTSPKSPSTRAS